MREYYYVLTVQWTNPTGGTTTASTSGVITPQAGNTREDLLRILLSKIRVGHRAAGTDPMPYDESQYSIVCWVLEPNALERPIGRQM